MGLRGMRLFASSEVFTSSEVFFGMSIMATHGTKRAGAMRPKQTIYALVQLCPPQSLDRKAINVSQAPQLTFLTIQISTPHPCYLTLSSGFLFISIAPYPATEAKPNQTTQRPLSHHASPPQPRIDSDHNIPSLPIR
jgi:hypothetical protein